MKISGVATMHAPAGRVWAALNDPAVLAATIPGLDRLEPTGPDSYRFTITAGVASVRGTYAGEIALSQRNEPSSFLLTASGAGGPGTVSTSVQVRLAATGDAETELTYDADATIGGLIAGVGQRMLTSVARRMAGEFFTSVDGFLAGNVAVATAPAPLATGAPVPVPAYTRPLRPAAASDGGFGRGVLVGAAIALAGVAVGALAGRRG
jgi:carbon monoxide dehydrogenase subunit G